MGGSTSQQTSTSNSQPWDAQQPYLKQGFEAAKKIYDGPAPGYFPNSTVAPATANQTGAWNAAGGQAAQAGQGIHNAMGFNNDVLSGKYLNNPYSDSVFKNISDKITPQVNSQFSQAGRYGSDSHAGAMTTAMTDAYAPYAAQQYQQGIGNMQTAAGNAGNLAQAGWSNLDNQSQMGGQQQQFGQMETNDAVNRFNYYQNLPQLRLNQFQQNVGGNWGGTSQTSTPVYQPGLFSQLLGGGLGIAGLLG